MCFCILGGSLRSQRKITLLLSNLLNHSLYGTNEGAHYYLEKTTFRFLLNKFLPRLP